MLRVVDRKEDIQIKSLGSSPISVYGAKKYTKIKEEFPYSLKDQPLILPTKHSKLRYDIEHHLMALKIQYDLIAEVQDSSVKKMMGEHGRGLIFLPEFAGKILVKEGRVHRIGRLGDVQEEYWILTRKRTIQSPITEEIMSNFKL